MVLFSMLYRVVLTFESVDEILRFLHPFKATEQCLYIEQSFDIL